MAIQLKMAVKVYPKSHDLTQNSSPKSKSDQTFYYYIKNGDFDIVWTNVGVFIVAHVLLIHWIYRFLSDLSDAHLRTFIYCKNYTT